MNSSVQKDDSFHLGHGGMSPQPVTVFSLWTKCLALLDVTCWMARHPLHLCQFHWVRKLGQHRCVAVSPFHVLFVRSLLPVLGIAVGETGVVRGGHVTQVAHDVHHFVVTQQAYYPATRLRGFFLKGHHQIHDFARLGAAIQEISYLYEGCFSAGPMVLLIYKTGAPENRDKIVKIIVYIGNRDYGFAWLRRSLCWSRPCCYCRQRNQEEKHASAASGDTDGKPEHLAASQSQIA